MLKGSPLKTPIDYIEALAIGAQSFYNYTGHKECLNLNHSQSGGLDHKGWNVQVCNEMVMPQASNGVTDMFLPDLYDK